MPGTNFPASLDTSTDLPAIASTDQENTPGKEHHFVTTNVNAAVLALETKLGADSSADTASVDYKLADARSRLTTAESAIATKADLVSGKVPSSQLPSYVDDVLEYANFAALPATGETGKIYVTLDDNAEYRWSGSTYIQLVASPGTTDSVPEGSTNLYFTAARVLAVVLTGLSTATNAAITATDTVLSALGKLQKQITDLIATVNGKVDQSITVNGHALSSNVTLTTADVADGTNKRYVTDAELAVLAATSGTNTGDQTNITGNAATATALQTARNINGQLFDGTADITIPTGGGGSGGSISVYFA